MWNKLFGEIICSKDWVSRKSNRMIIDTHCHLIDKKFENCLEVIKRAVEVGVEKIIVPGVSMKNSEEVVSLCEESQFVYGMVGVHPEEIIEGKVIEDVDRDKLRLWLENPNVVGVGEIGLDFYWDKERKSKKEQLIAFEDQLMLAIEHNKPAMVHMRGAEEEMWEFFKSHKLPSIQMHCWSGSEDFLNWCLSNGMMVSFAGNITFKGAEELRRLVKMVPIEQLLIETDSPYLSPEPVRGRTNEPKNVKIIGEFVAYLRNITPEKLFEQTTKNALCFFSLENL